MKEAGSWDRTVKGRVRASGDFVMIVLEAERGAQLEVGKGITETYSRPRFTTTSPHEELMKSFTNTALTKKTERK